MTHTLTKKGDKTLCPDCLFHSLEAIRYRVSYDGCSRQLDETSGRPVTCKKMRKEDGLCGKDGHLFVPGADFWAPIDDLMNKMMRDESLAVPVRNARYAVADRAIRKFTRTLKDSLRTVGDIQAEWRGLIALVEQACRGQ